MNQESLTELQHQKAELERLYTILGQGTPGPRIVAGIRTTLARLATGLRVVMDDEAAANQGRRSYAFPLQPSKPQSSLGSGNCGWCNEYINTDLFKHVQQCRKGWEAKEAAKVRATAEALQRMAQDLEEK